MPWSEAILLAVVQGITEFLPVSSSGHLATVSNYLHGFGEEDLAYHVILHLGTLVAVLVYYRRDLGAMALSLLRPGSQPALPRRLVWYLAGSTLTTFAVYLAFGRAIKSAFGSLRAIAVSFLITGIILALSRLARGAGRAEPQLRWRDALGVGAAQGVALLPGVSRSGSTITAALLLGLDRELAVRYSFLLSIPAILGAAVIEGRELGFAGAPWGVYLIGALVSGLTGYAAIQALLKLVRRGRFASFAWYCWALGAAILIQQSVAARL